MMTSPEPNGDTAPLVVNGTKKNGTTTSGVGSSGGGYRTKATHLTIETKDETEVGLLSASGTSDGNKHDPKTPPGYRGHLKILEMMCPGM